MYKGYIEKPSEEEQKCIDKVSPSKRLFLNTQAKILSPKRLCDKINKELEEVLKEENRLCILYYQQGHKEVKGKLDACRKEFDRLNNEIVYLVNKYPEIIGE